MDIFKKEQTIEAVKTVVRARWFYILTMAFQAAIIRMMFPATPMADSLLIFLATLLVLVSNFGFWLYFRRPPEKISNWKLKIIKGTIIPFDQVMFWLIFYFSGTANKMLFVAYFITVMFGAALYKVRGVVLITLSASLLYGSLVLLEYFGLMPSLSYETIAQSPYKSLKGELLLVKGQLIAFNLYLLVVAIVAGYLAGLFKRREKTLISQRDELAKKTEALLGQTQQLTQTKDLLQGALIKSDKARLEATKAQDDLGKANLELKGRMRELETFSGAAVGRELKMIELKKEIKNLQETIKKLESRPSKKK